MGLIENDLIELKDYKNVAYYENKGYKLPKKPNGKYDINKSFFIFAKDLCISSNKKIRYVCEICGETHSCSFSTFNNKYFKSVCEKCSRKLRRKKENITRLNVEYKDFVQKVLYRDNYTCINCGYKSSNLQVHHLDGYNWCIEKRIDVSNGVTLCYNCHRNFHALYGIKNNTKKQFEQWIDKIIEVNGDVKIPPTRKVYCIEKNKIYDSRKDASLDIGVDTSTIGHCCNGHLYTCKNYHLMWYDEYLNATDEYILQLLSHTYIKEVHNVISLYDGNLYESSIDLARKYKVDPTNIKRSCDGKTTLINSKNKIRLTNNNKFYNSIFYSDYIRLNNDDKKRILEHYKEYFVQDSFLFKQFTPEPV